MNSDLADKTIIFKIFFSFYFCFREDLDPPPVGFCCLFVFSPCSRSSGLSLSFSASFGHICLLDSFILLFLVLKASILFNFGFSLFLSKKSFGASRKSKKGLPNHFRASFFLIFRCFDGELNSAFRSARDFTWSSSGE